MLRIGDTLPDMQMDALHGDEIRRVSLRDSRGRWVVLVAYPADFTFVCPTELAEAADLHDEFRAAGADVYCVSTDTVWTHQAWREASPTVAAIRFPMLADPSGRLCRALGTYDEDAGVSLRGTFIADPEGVVQTMEVHADGIGRNMRETLRKLQAAAFVRDSKGEV
ncbi:MAG TPA: peroxiredoxin, partial [Candidatus Thermoplasmatota archaeon]|nr:peroxiredoxin [Candidatus Thermoplasmatota archaeon]